jgi:hypothetical protein
MILQELAIVIVHRGHSYIASKSNNYVRNSSEKKLVAERHNSRFLYLHACASD